MSFYHCLMISFSITRNKSISLHFDTKWMQLLTYISDCFVIWQWGVDTYVRLTTSFHLSSLQCAIYWDLFFSPNACLVSPLFARCICAQCLFCLNWIEVNTKFLVWNQRKVNAFQCKLTLYSHIECRDPANFICK